MAFGPNSKNPRERRAFTHMAHTAALSEPTPANIARALEWDNAMAQGPNKSRRMGQSRAAQAALADYVFIIDGGTYAQTGEEVGWTIPKRRGDPIRRHPGEHLYGHVVSKEVADAWKADPIDFDKRPTLGQW
jgi:hypothetical protein